MAAILGRARGFGGGIVGHVNGERPTIVIRIGEILPGVMRDIAAHRDQEGAEAVGDHARNPGHQGVLTPRLLEAVEAEKPDRVVAVLPRRKDGDSRLVE
jgi:hypothetical protein